MLGTLAQQLQMSYFTLALSQYSLWTYLEWHAGAICESWNISSGDLLTQVLESMPVFFFFYELTAYLIVPKLSCIALVISLWFGSMPDISLF